MISYKSGSPDESAIILSMINKINIMINTVCVMDI